MYNTDYFIKKFEAIPEKMWLVDSTGYHGQPRCANGHCFNENSYSDESNGLRSVFLNLRITSKTKEYKYLSVDLKVRGYSRMAEHINNGLAEEYQQSTPKQRVLAALYDIKAKEATFAEEILSNLTKEENVQMV